MLIDFVIFIIAWHINASETLSVRYRLQLAFPVNCSLLGYQDLPFSVQSTWFAGNAQVRTFALNELLGTKVRALYQRKKGRDLFDLWYALVHCDCDPKQIIDCFLKYMEHGGRKIGRKELELNLQEKLSDSRFLTDVPALIRTGLEYDYNTACEIVIDKLVSLVPD